MAEPYYYVVYRVDPVKVIQMGQASHPVGAGLVANAKDGDSDTRLVEVTKEQFCEIADSPEPSRILAEMIGLRYQKYYDDPDGATPNIVELIADESAFDQACRFANRVEHHAVYCHNDRWVDAPRKCHWGDKMNCCPGFEKKEE